MEKKDLMVGTRRYDWVKIAGYIKEKLDNGVKEEDIIAEMKTLIGGGKVTVEWAKRFFASKTLEEARTNFATKTQEARAIKEFFPQWKGQLPKATKGQPKSFPKKSGKGKVATP